MSESKNKPTRSFKDSLMDFIQPKDDIAKKTRIEQMAYLAGLYADEKSDFLDVSDKIEEFFDSIEAEGKRLGRIDELERWVQWASDAALDGISPLTLGARIVELKEESK